MFDSTSNICWINYGNFTIEHKPVIDKDEDGNCSRCGARLTQVSVEDAKVIQVCQKLDRDEAI